MLRGKRAGNKQVFFLESNLAYILMNGFGLSAKTVAKKKN